MLAVRAELVEPDQEQPGEVLGDALVPQRARRHELLDEEGVPLGALDHRADLPLREGPRGDAVDQLADRGVGQRLELEPVQVPEPRPVRQRGAQRVAPVQVVTAVGGDDGDGATEAPGEQQGQQVAGGLVGPVDVLDHDEDGAHAGEVLQRRVDGLDELAAVDGLTSRSGGQLVGTAPAAREEPGQVRVRHQEALDGLGLVHLEAAQHLAEGQVGQGLAGLAEAVADEDRPACVTGPAGDLGEQPGLADAGVAGQQDETGGVSTRPESDEVGEPRGVRLAPHEHSPGGTVQTHDPDYVGAVGHRGGGRGHAQAGRGLVRACRCPVRTVRRAARTRPAW